MTAEAKVESPKPVVATAPSRAPHDRGVLLHAVVLAVAIACALFVWTRSKDTKSLGAGDVTVWSGRAADVRRIAYETKTKKIALESKKDATGRYFVGTVDKESAPPKGAADAGAPEKPATKTTVTVVSVGEGEKVADALAPLKALRALGKLPDERLAEFGLGDPDGTLTVDVGGTEHKLVVGSSQSGGDRYVRDPQSGEIYALKGDLVRDLDSADSRLVERDLHDWKDADVQTAKVTAGDKTRSMVRAGPEGKRFWADKQAPDTNDETLGNWMSKLERLHPVDFVAALPDKKEPVLRIEFAAGRPIGFVELVKAPGDKGKSDYYVTSERTRLYAKVTQSTAEQVEQDLSGILK